MSKTPTFLSPQHERLSAHMLADGLKLVYDPQRSHGHWFVDANSSEEYLDTFSFFASGAIGHRHPVFEDPSNQAELLEAARVKPSLADIYTESYVGFVEAVARITPGTMPHHFFVEGGALAVENALKAAFDWKVRKNLQAGLGEKGHQVVHFIGAFHGRSGYTLSITNTHSAVKTEYFPKFRWPRIPAPAMRFPCEGASLDEVVAAEEESLDRLRQAFIDNPDDIAAVIIEPIQSEGGDRHFRAEFFKALREITLEHDALLILDEVQTGLGLTGKWWCHEHFGMTPDIIAFGKKTQVGGIAATRRLDEVDSVFQVSSRINSTFGGNLTDMVRSRMIIEAIESDRLVANAAKEGAALLADIEDFVAERPEKLANARGRGLMVAFDFNSGDERDRFVVCGLKANLLLLGCGERTLRFRPYLNFDETTRGELMTRLASTFDLWMKSTS